MHALHMHMHMHMHMHCPQPEGCKHAHAYAYEGACTDGVHARMHMLMHIYMYAVGASVRRLPLHYRYITVTLPLQWGHPYDGYASYALGLYAFAAFFVFYLAHGLLKP